MQALDTTIANVALPYIQGSVSASADQINWVLTSYIVAAAIMTPPSGFLANRFGRKRVLMTAIAGFVRRLDPLRHRAIAGRRSSASACCRASSARRWFRSSQVDPARHLHAGGARLGDGAVRRVGDGRAGAGAGDRRLADRPHSAGAGCSTSTCRSARSPSPAYQHLRARDQDGRPRPSSTGSDLAALSVAIAALQVFLDRGAQLDWFSSVEILIEAVVCASAFYIFLVHTFTATKFVRESHGCSSTAISRSACSSSSSSASPIWPRWR